MGLPKTAQKKVLLAGGAGFIGSHLSARLVDEGYNVVCVDNLCSGQKSNIVHLLDKPNFSFLELDLLKEDEFAKLSGSYDFIFHMASPASPVFYKKYAVETLLVNSLGTVKLLELAIQAGARFLFTSTSEIYGDPLEHPQKETYWGNVDPIGSKAHYKEAKRFGEAAVATYVRQRGVDGRLVRIFNTYGPRNRADDGRVMPNFINQALQGEPLTIYGEGKQTRSYCYVSDLVEGLMRVMFRDGLKGEVFNLGNPEEYTILQTAEIIRELVNPKLEFNYLPIPPEDPKRRKPDITKAREVLDWQPKVGFKEGIQKTIEYFKSIRN